MTRARLTVSCRAGAHLVAACVRLLPRAPRSAAAAAGPALAMVAFISLAAVQTAVAVPYALQVQAQPQRPRADGVEPCAITVRVTDPLGAPVRDGTQVTFVATLGTLDPQTALTAGGIARTELKSITAGRAEVSILVEGQRDKIIIEFVGVPAKPPPKPAPMVKIVGKYVAYSADYDCITATDDAQAQHGALKIEAGNLQYEVARGVLKAQHSVRITGGGATLEGERACYRVATCEGVLLRAQDAVERIAFRADDLRASAPGAAQASDFLPTDTSSTNTWVVAREAIVFPNERIQFANARLYVGNRRIFSLPHYVTPLIGQRSLLNQVFSVSSGGGVNLDLPFYYHANESHAGSLHLIRRAAGSYGYGRTGWSLGLEEQYRLSNSSRGKLAVDDLTDSTRSFRLDHQIEFSPRSRVNMGLNYYRWDSSYPAALTGRAFYTQRLRGADLSVIGLTSAIGGTTSWSLDGNTRWTPKPIFRTGINYDLSANLGYGSSQYGYGGGLCLGGGVGLTPREWNVTRSTAASLDLAQQFTWAQIGGPCTTFDARAMLRQSLGVLGAATLSYDYTLSRGGYYATYGREQLSLNAYLNQGMVWRASGFASYSLDLNSLFASGNVSYRLPLQMNGSGQSPWRLDLRGSYTAFGVAKSMSSRIAIGRALGRYEALVCFSPNGSYGYGSYGYGYGRGKTFWVEFAPLGF